MKYVVFTIAAQNLVILQTNEARNAADKAQGEVVELETDDMTEALNKCTDIANDKKYTFQNRMDASTDWDSVEMDKARKEAEQDKLNKDAKAEEKSEAVANALGKKKE